MACKLVAYMSNGTNVVVTSSMEVDEMKQMLLDAMDKKYKYISFNNTHAFDMIMMDKVVNFKVTLY